MGMMIFPLGYRTRDLKLKTDWFSSLWSVVCLMKVYIIRMAEAFEKDKIRGYPEFSNTYYRIVSILGIEQSPVFRIMDEHRIYDGPVKSIVKQIHQERVVKRRKNQVKLCKLDDFDLSVFRRTVHAIVRKYTLNKTYHTF